MSKIKNREVRRSCKSLCMRQREFYQGLGTHHQFMLILSCYRSCTSAFSTKGIEEDATRAQRYKSRSASIWLLEEESTTSRADTDQGELR